MCTACAKTRRARHRIRMRAKNRLVQIVLTTSPRPKSCWTGIEKCQCHVMGASAATFAKQTG